MLAVIGALAPVEPPDLPAPFGGHTGANSAHAQTPPPKWVETGDPSDCSTVPAPWSPQPGDPDEDTAAECVLEIDVCPASRLSSGRNMVLSTQYPNFCEERAEEAVDLPLYNQCTGEQGLAVQINGPVGNRVCQLVHPTTCSDGLHRINATTCRAVQRRTWECGPGLVPRNEFNSCYRPPPANTLPTHPACGAGAPDFSVGTCDDYVSNDFLRNPAPVHCGSFDTGSLATAMRQEPVNDYWCRYDASWMAMRCHNPGTTCASSPALCIKRASLTGGCDSVANTIRCRDLQAEFAAGSITAEAVYAADCEPCAIIPFQPVPANCPTTFSGAPAEDTSYRSNQFDTIHRVGQDFHFGDNACQSVRAGGPMTSRCASQPVCADPPKGSLTWTSTHHAQVAVISAPTILTIEDTPWQQTSVRHHTYRWSASRRPVRISTSTALRYPGGRFPVRLWPQIGSSVQPSTIAQLVRDGECVFRHRPEFRLIVEELWPDNPQDYAAIQQLFGDGALDWWNALTSQLQEAQTVAHGLRWWPTLIPAEQQERTDDLRQEVACNFGANAWCRWTPTRTGYYRLKAAGAWIATRQSARTWLDPNSDPWYFNNLLNYLSDADNRTNLAQELTNMGRTPADLGLTPNLTGLLPLPPNPGDWAFSDPGTYRTACPPIDFRFLCTSGLSTANYTETEYVGIQVHEIRVQTVTPSN